MICLYNTCLYMNSCILSNYRMVLNFDHAVPRLFLFPSKYWDFQCSSPPALINLSPCFSIQGATFYQTFAHNLLGESSPDFARISLIRVWFSAWQRVTFLHVQISVVPQHLVQTWCGKDVAIRKKDKWKKSEISRWKR